MDNYYKILPDGPQFNVPEVVEAPPPISGYRAFVMEGTEADLNTVFVDGVQFKRFYDSEQYDEAGNLIVDELGDPIYLPGEEDLTEYVVRGYIMLLADGSHVMYMRKKTELELTQDDLAAALAAAIM